jgi:hypothetical protein
MYSIANQSRTFREPRVSVVTARSDKGHSNSNRRSVTLDQ